MSGGEPGDYNRVYESLVSADDDLTGLVAYAVYKRDKRDFLIQWLERHGSSPSAEQMRTFVASVLTPGQQQRYRVAARTILDSFASTAVEAERASIVKEAVTQRIESAAKRIEDAGVWWRQIPAGVASALVYTILFICVVIALRFAGIDLVAVFQSFEPPNAAR